MSYQSKNINGVRIAQGNNKLGTVDNISLTPGKGCNHCCACKESACYALKSYLMYPAVKNAWDGNLNVAVRDMGRFFDSIRSYLAKSGNKWFRWHVAGDILDQTYLEGMKQIATEFPNVKFLAFTKMHDLDYSDLPCNLQIVFSMWPGFGDTEKDMPRAWYQDGNETRVPSNAIECPGFCETCHACWSLGKIKRDVTFIKH